MKERIPSINVYAKEQNESAILIIGGIFLSAILFRLIMKGFKKIIGKVGANVELSPEKLESYIDELCDDIKKENSHNENDIELIRQMIHRKIISGEIKTIGDMIKYIES